MLYIEFNIYGETNKELNIESKIKSLLEMLKGGKGSLSFCLFSFPVLPSSLSGSKNEISKNCESNSRPAARLETQYPPHHVLFYCYSRRYESY